MYEYPRIWDEMLDVAMQKESAFHRAMIEVREINKLRRKGELEKMEPNALKKIVDEEFKRREALQKAKKKAEPTLKELMEKLDDIQAQINSIQNQTITRTNSATPTRPRFTHLSNFTLSQPIPTSSIAASIEEWELQNTTIDASIANYRGEYNLKIIESEKTPVHTIENALELTPELALDFSSESKPHSRVVSRQHSRVESRLGHSPESRLGLSPSRPDSRTESKSDYQPKPDYQLNSIQNRADQTIQKANTLFKKLQKSSHNRTYSL